MKYNNYEYKKYNKNEMKEEKKSKQKYRKETKKKKKRMNKNILDGFFILEKTGIKWPEQIFHFNATDMNITNVKSNELVEFLNLSHIDLSGNNIKLEQLASLPSLEECRLACNNISELITSDIYCSFTELRFLDLSFNKLNSKVFESLCKLPKLSHLNLSHNEINKINDNYANALSRMSSIQTLSLRGNPLGKQNSLVSQGLLFEALAKLPILRELDISHCNLTRLPNFVQENNNLPFRSLTLLNLAHNQFISDNLGSLVQLSNLKKLDLRFNPCVDEVENNNATVITSLLVQTCQCIVALYDPSDDKRDYSHLLMPNTLLMSNVAETVENNNELSTTTNDNIQRVPIVNNHIPQWILNEAKKDWKASPSYSKYKAAHQAASQIRHIIYHRI